MIRDLVQWPKLGFRTTPLFRLRAFRKYLLFRDAPLSDRVADERRTG